MFDVHADDVGWVHPDTPTTQSRATLVGPAHTVVLVGRQPFWLPRRSPGTRTNSMPAVSGDLVGVPDRKVVVQATVRGSRGAEDAQRRRHIEHRRVRRV